jgi:PTS system cellobiose-specific IIC component
MSEANDAPDVALDSAPEKTTPALRRFLDAYAEFTAPIFDFPYLAGLRDGLAALFVPLVIGTFFLIILQFPVQRWLNVVENDPVISRILWVPFNMTFGFLALFATATISYGVARRRDLEPLVPSLLATMIFLVFTNPITGTWGESGFPNSFLDNSGLFTAIAIALITVGIYDLFTTLYNAITKGGKRAAAWGAGILIPLGFLSAWFMRVVLNIDLAWGVLRFFSFMVPAADTLSAALFAETLHSFLWTLGIHGDLTIGIVLSPLWISNLADNAAAAAAGLTPVHIYTSEFRSYVVPGGSGATLPLAFYLMFSRSPRLRKIGWWGVWPCIFNINEPITFGLPIICNPFLAIPFVLITFLNTFVAYTAHLIGLVTPIFITAPWTLPTPILQYVQSGYDWRAIPLAIVTEFIIPGIIWYPFIRLYASQMLREEALEKSQPHEEAPSELS